MHTLSEQADKAPGGSAHETTRAAFTGKTLTRKSRERPVKGAGAVVSLGSPWGLCTVPGTGTSPLMSLVWIQCAALGEEIVWASPVLNSVHTSLVQNG